MAAQMRAKLRLNNIQPVGDPKSVEVLTFHAVARSDAYPEDGSDENNTYAKMSPSANLTIHVTNPALLDQFAVGECYYVDFTPV